MSVTTSQMAGADVFSRYWSARLRLEASLLDESAALLRWRAASDRDGVAGPGTARAWDAFLRAAEVREREARALASATEELADAMRAAVAEVRRG